MNEFGHERLDVYRAAVEWLVLADEFAAALPKGRAIWPTKCGGEPRPFRLTLLKAPASLRVRTRLVSTGWRDDQRQNALQFWMLVTH